MKNLSRNFFSGVGAIKRIRDARASVSKRLGVKNDKDDRAEADLEKIKRRSRSKVLAVVLICKAKLDFKKCSNVISMYIYFISYQVNRYVLEILDE